MKLKDLANKCTQCGEKGRGDLITSICDRCTVANAVAQALEALAPLNEESYIGNLGVMEMMKFYTVATEQQKVKMRQFLAKKDYDGAWQFLQDVTGIRLK